MQILINPISALNVCESPKFPRLTGNRGLGTRWWCQTLDQKWKYGRIAHAQWKICNITIIIGTVRSLWIGYGADYIHIYFYFILPCSTERISSLQRKKTYGHLLHTPHATPTATIRSLENHRKSIFLTEFYRVFRLSYGSWSTWNYLDACSTQHVNAPITPTCIFTRIGVDRIFSGIHFFLKKLTTFL